MARPSFATGFSQSLGQGLQLGRALGQKREAKRQRAIDEQIGTVLSEPDPVKKDLSVDTSVNDTAMETGELKEMPMAMRYAIDGDNKIARVDKLLMDKHGAFTPEYMQARAAYRDELQGMQQELMTGAKQALASGDKDQAAEMLTRAYSMFPNGKGIDIREKDGELYGIGFDTKNLTPDGSLAITPESIDFAAREMADKDKFDMYLFKLAKERREEAAEDRAKGAYDWERKQDSANMKLLDTRAKLAELQYAIAQNPEYGLRAQTKEELSKLQQDMKKARADTFEATAKAWYYLDGGANRGQPRYPGGLKASDWDRRVADLRKNIEGRGAGDIGVSEELYNDLYEQNGDLVYQLAMAGLKRSLTEGEAYDPADIIATAEELALQKIQADRASMDGNQ